MMEKYKEFSHLSPGTQKRVIEKEREEMSTWPIKKWEWYKFNYDITKRIAKGIGCSFSVSYLGAGVIVVKLSPTPGVERDFIPCIEKQISDDWTKCNQYQMTDEFLMNYFLCTYRYFDENGNEEK